jgi:hypothetical protein
MVSGRKNRRRGVDAGAGTPAIRSRDHDVKVFSNERSLKSSGLNQSGEVVNGQQANSEDSSGPWKVRDQTVGPKKKAPVPRHAGFDRGR